MARKIKVMVGQLTKPLTVSRVKWGTSLGDFLKARKMEYSSSVRVNGEAVNANHKLESEDIVTIMERVNGGS